MVFEVGKPVALKELVMEDVKSLRSMSKAHRYVLPCVRTRSDPAGLSHFSKAMAECLREPPSRTTGLPIMSLDSAHVLSQLPPPKLESWTSQSNYCTSRTELLVRLNWRGHAQYFHAPFNLSITASCLSGCFYFLADKLPSRTVRISLFEHILPSHPSPYRSTHTFIALSHLYLPLSPWFWFHGYHRFVI